LLEEKKMKALINHSVIALLAAMAPGCGALEPKDNTSDRPVTPGADATAELRLSPQPPVPSSQGKPGSISVEKSIWVQQIVWTLTNPASEQRCLLLEGSSLHSVAASGTDGGSLSATVYAPPEAAKKSKDKICPNGNRVRVRANDQLIGRVFTASDARLVLANTPSNLQANPSPSKCLLISGHRIRLTGKRIASAGFIGTIERVQPPRPTGLMLSDECQNNTAVIASPKDIQQVLQKPEGSPPKPVAKMGRIVLEKPVTVEHGDVPTIMIFPLPPAPQCALLAGSVLTKVKSAGKGALVATIEHAAAPLVSTTQLKLSLAYCEAGRLVKLKVGSDFQAMALTNREGWFNRTSSLGELSTLPLEKIPATSDLCYVTPNRRNLRISGIHGTTGEFLGTVVAAQELEDTRLRPGECSVNDTIIAESEGIAKILGP
jgi:hypothetical protein